MRKLRMPLLSLLIGSMLTTPVSAAGLTVDEVIKMTNIGVSDQVIVTAIQASGATFSLSQKDIDALKAGGVSQAVIDAMQATAPRSTPQAQPSPDEEEAPPARSNPAPARQEEADPEEEDDVAPPPARVEPNQPAPATAAPSRAASSMQTRPAALKEIEKKYKAGKFTSAAADAYELLSGANEGRYADWRTDILYWLSKSLLKLGYVHSAHDLMLQVAKAGPADPNFANSLIYLTLTSRKLSDYRDLRDVFQTAQPTEVPAKANNAYLYLMGEAKYEAEDLADALKYLERVSPKSEFYAKAHYLEGVIRYRQGDNTNAARIFRELIDADDLRGNVDEILNVQAQALLGMARIYYRVEDFQRANKLYALMPRDSSWWPRALYESAYSNFWLQDYNSSLGQLLTIYSPFFGDRVYLPDATILETLVYFNLCEYEYVNALVKEFQAKWKPVRDGLRAFSGQYAGKELDAYQALFGEADSNTLPRSVVQEIAWNSRIQSIQSHLGMVNTELAAIEQGNVRWKESPLARSLILVLKDAQTRLKTDAGKVVLAEVGRLDKSLSNLIGESDIIQFEVVSAQKEDYEEKFQNPEYVETYENLQYNYATEPSLIYWPFTGEFWVDELGYYKFTERGACKR